MPRHTLTGKWAAAFPFHPLSYAIDIKDVYKNRHSNKADSMSMEVLYTGAETRRTAVNINKYHLAGASTFFLFVCLGGWLNNSLHRQADRGGAIVLRH